MTRVADVGIGGIRIGGTTVGPDAIPVGVHVSVGVEIQLVPLPVDGAVRVEVAAALDHGEDLPRRRIGLRGLFDDYRADRERRAPVGWRVVPVDGER